MDKRHLAELAKEFSDELKENGVDRATLLRMLGRVVNETPAMRAAPEWILTKDDKPPPRLHADYGTVYSAPVLVAFQGPGGIIERSDRTWCWCFAGEGGWVPSDLPDGHRPEDYAGWNLPAFTHWMVLPEAPATPAATRDYDLAQDVEYPDDFAQHHPSLD